MANQHGREVIIEPRTPSVLTSLKDTWASHHLIYFFGARMIRLRYSGALLGWLWLFIRPLVTALFFTMIFSKMAKLPSDGSPYLVFFLAGMMVWSFFSNSLLFMTRSLRSSRRLITKLHFPKMIVPLASIAPFGLEFLIYVVVFGAVLGYYFITDGVLYLLFRPELLWSFFYLLIVLLLLVGIGLWTSILNSQARDVRFTLPYVLQMWFFITPVLYPLSLVPERWKWFTHLNPMAVAVEGFRWSVLGTGGVTSLDLSLATIQSIAVFLSGIWFFSKAESKLADNF